MSDPNVEVEDKDEDKVETAASPFLGMSDADMMNAPPPVVEKPAADGEKAVVAAAEKKPEANAADDEGGGGDEAADPAAPKDEKQPGDAKDGDDKGGDEPPAKAPADAAAEDKTKAKDAKNPADEKKVEGESKVEGTKEEAKIDFEAEYKRLLAPFKANGRDIQVNSVDDAVALMQMGANYNKKMAALKPNLKLMKMLENNGLLSEDKISFLIDLGKKNPAAINKLVKDSGLDPMDLDAEKASTYKQTAYAVDDREIELDTVLDELQGSPTYTQTLDVVSNKWDVASKQVVAQTPQLLKVLDGHMASGIYDLISTEVERERLFGRLNGMSDIEAYRQVGDAIQARGGFNHLTNIKGKTKPVEQEVVQPKTKPAEDDTLKDKRRAASSTKTAAPSAAAAAKDFNPLALSDDDFSKLAKPIP